MNAHDVLDYHSNWSWWLSRAIMHFSFLSKCQLREALGLMRQLVTAMSAVHLHVDSAINGLMASMVVLWASVARVLLWVSNFTDAPQNNIILQVVGSILWSAVLCIMFYIWGDISGCDSCNHLYLEATWHKHNLKSWSTMATFLQFRSFDTIYCHQTSLQQHDIQYV